MSGTSNEEITHQLVKYLLRGNSAGLQFDDKRCVKPYRQLSPFIASVDQFPDAYVLHRESGLPLCTIEVHSCQRYDHSVCKTIIGVVTQLRLLRHFADIDSCIGFTFPKPNEKSAVTHVQVTWNQLHFGYKLQQLEAQGVKQASLHVDMCMTKSAYAFCEHFIEVACGTSRPLA